MAEAGGGSTVALVTGAAHGIGFEASRQLAQRGVTVFLTARSPGKREPAARELAEEGLDVRPDGLDVSDDASVEGSVVWAATLPDDGPTGGFFRDGKPLPW